MAAGAEAAGADRNRPDRCVISPVSSAAGFSVASGVVTIRTEEVPLIAAAGAGVAAASGHFVHRIISTVSSSPEQSVSRLRAS